MALVYNSGTINPRKLKFEMWVGNQICKVVLQLRRANGYRVIEKGPGSTFEVSHTLLGCRTIVQIS